MAVYVHLVRHGEVENPGALSYGRLPGFRLSEEGRRQAAITAEYLQAFGGRVRRVVTSPLERARETADIIRDALDVREPEVDTRLIEASSWRDGLPRALAPLAYAKRYFSPEHRAKTEGPTAIALRMREAILDAKSWLEHDGDACVLVSHQTPIWWARVALGKGMETFGRSFLQNVTPWIHVKGPCDLASVTTFIFEEGSHRPRFRYFSP